MHLYPSNINTYKIGDIYTGCTCKGEKIKSKKPHLHYGLDISIVNTLFNNLNSINAHKKFNDK